MSLNLGMDFAHLDEIIPYLKYKWKATDSDNLK